MQGTGNDIQHLWDGFYHNPMSGNHTGSDLVIQGQTNTSFNFRLKHWSNFWVEDANGGGWNGEDEQVFEGTAVISNNSATYNKNNCSIRFSYTVDTADGIQIDMGSGCADRYGFGEMLYVEQDSTASKPGDFTVDKRELKNILETALQTGQLGPFSIELIGKDFSIVENKYGRPDNMYLRFCTECDDHDGASYGFEMVLPKITSIYLSVDLSEKELKSLIGEPDRIEYGMEELLMYSGDQYSLGVAVSSDGTYRVYLFDNSQWNT